MSQKSLTSFNDGIIRQWSKFEASAPLSQRKKMNIEFNWQESFIPELLKAVKISSIYFNQCKNQDHFFSK